MEKDNYAGSRILYIVIETAAYLISILTSGAYLAKLTSALGLSDSLTAVLGSFTALGCVFQLIAIAVFKKGRVKKRVIALNILSQLLFTAIYIVPFAKMNIAVKNALFVAFLLLGNAILQIIFAPKTNWFMSLVPDGQRGMFTSIKEATSLICGILFQLLMGVLIDKYEAAGNIKAAFVVCTIAVFALMLINTLSLALSKEKEPVQNKKKSLFAGFKEIIFDKSIVPVIFTSVFWTTCTHITTPFFGTYQIKELGFGMTFVGALSMVYALVRIPCSFFLGKYADKNSFAKMLKICYFIAALGFLAASFTKPENGHVMYTIYYVLYAAAMGGINSAEINLIFDYAPPEKRSNALAVKQTVYGICGFAATLAATPLVNHIQSAGNMFLGFHVYAQQVLSAISFIMIILLIVYVDKIILKIKPYRQEQTH